MCVLSFFFWLLFRKVEQYVYFRRVLLFVNFVSFHEIPNISLGLAAFFVVCLRSVFFLSRHFFGSCSPSPGVIKSVLIFPLRVTYYYLHFFFFLLSLLFSLRFFLRSFYLGTKNIVNLCIKYNVPRLIYTSSASVTLTPYLGKAPFAVVVNQTESKIKAAASDSDLIIPGYSVTKLRAERIVLGAHGTNLSNGTGATFYLITICHLIANTYTLTYTHIHTHMHELTSKHWTVAMLPPPPPRIDILHRQIEIFQRTIKCKQMLKLTDNSLPFLLFAASVYSSMFGKITAYAFCFRAQSERNGRER